MIKSIRILLQVGILLSLAGSASACSCAEDNSPNQALAKADAVFAGKVLDITAVQPRNSWDERRIRLRVRRSWKGRCGDVAAVISPSDGCGYSFTRGEYYVVYAYRSKDGQLRTSMCTRTVTLRKAGEDLAAFGEPDLLTSLKREEQVELFARFGVIAACSLALMAIFVLRRRRPGAPDGAMPQDRSI